VDIHSHLLPGIDDGAVTIEDTLFLIHELQKMGFKQFITTPHIYTTVWDNTKAIIQQKYNETLPALAKDTSIKAENKIEIDKYNTTRVFIKLKPKFRYVDRSAIYQIFCCFL
jgi:tyrosine-protein phosphatase YwqE